MRASFWRALDALGASGSARFNWKHRLGRDWDDCAQFLKPTGQTAFCVIDPRKPRYLLTVSPQGEEGFVGYYEDDTSIPPVPFTARDVAEFAPHWKPIARALASAVPFDHGAWEPDGQVRRIGSVQDAFGHVRPVLLFLPGGHLGDHAVLVRSLIDRTECTVLLPSSRWITGEIESLRDRNGLTFVDLSERLAQIEANPGVLAPLPATGSRKANGSPGVQAVIQGGNGLTWSQVRIEVTAGKRIRLMAPGQDREYSFPPNIQVTEDHALGVLMRLASTGEWRNPPVASPEHERVSRSFRRLRTLLKGLVPLPGDPFRKHRGAYIPVFQIGVHRGLLPENQRCRTG